MSEIPFARLGLMPYDEAFAWQRERAHAVRAGREPEVVGALQHPPVYTLGMRARREHLLVSEDALRERGADVVQTDRGGDVTFHGPGQLVAYPVLDLRARGLGPAEYVRLLEACVIETLAAFGIEGQRIQGRPGVWVRNGAAKIAAIGVRIRDGVSMHGLALNVTTDLSWFDAIVPCGIADAAVTSIAAEISTTPDFERVTDVFLGAFAGVLGVRVVESGPSLGIPALRPVSGRTAVTV
jgi:lipoyl(octanoyl) transferase